MLVFLAGPQYAFSVFLAIESFFFGLDYGHFYPFQKQKPSFFFSQPTIGLTDQPIDQSMIPFNSIQFGLENWQKLIETEPTDTHQPLYNSIRFGLKNWQKLIKTERYSPLTDNSTLMQERREGITSKFWHASLNHSLLEKRPKFWYGFSKHLNATQIPTWLSLFEIQDSL